MFFLYNLEYDYSNLKEILLFLIKYLDFSIYTPSIHCHFFMTLYFFSD